MTMLEKLLRWFLGKIVLRFSELGSCLAEDFHPPSLGKSLKKQITLTSVISWTQFSWERDNCTVFLFYISWCGCPLGFVFEVWKHLGHLRKASARKRQNGLNLPYRREIAHAHLMSHKDMINSLCS